LVEDDQTMRVAAQQLLSKVGYRVVTAVDGRQGVDAYRAHRAELQLIITDVVMPQLSGFELYEVIRGESRGLSVLFMSGFPAPHFRKTVGQDSRVAFVTKPCTAPSASPAFETARHGTLRIADMSNTAQKWTTVGVPKAPTSGPIERASAPSTTTTNCRPVSAAADEPIMT